jgi:hypothetical protein
MSIQTGVWQGAKQRRSGATASICNTARRPFECSPCELASYRSACVVARAWRGITTRRPVRLACRAIPGQCEAPFTENRPYGTSQNLDQLLAGKFAIRKLENKAAYEMAGLSLDSRMTRNSTLAIGSNCRGMTASFRCRFVRLTGKHPSLAACTSGWNPRSRRL